MLIVFVPCQHGLEPQPVDLVLQLRSEDPSVRLRAAKQLAKLGKELPKEAIGPLVEVLNGTDHRLHGYAIQALTHTEERHSYKAIIGLVAALESQRTNATSWYAQLAITEIGKPAVKPIIEVLKSGKRRSIHGVLYDILGSIGAESQEAIPVLEDGLKADALGYRLRAASAIVKIDAGNKSVKDVLTSALKNCEWRLFAAESLARSRVFKTKDALSVLLEILADEKETTINAYNRATVAVGNFGPLGRDALPLLAKHLEKWKKTSPALGVLVAGAIVKIDAKNAGAIAFLEAEHDALEAIAQPNNDRIFSDFAKDLLHNVLQKKEKRK
jgi:HEAT repeat protein